MSSYHLIKPEESADSAPTSFEELDFEEQRLGKRRTNARGQFSPRIIKIAAGVVIALMGFYIIFFQGANISKAFRKAQGLSPEQVRAEWIQTAMDHPIDRVVSQGPIADLCESTTWKEGLVFNCTQVNGGFGNIRSNILNCLRYAIDAGASGFVLPQIQLRSDKNLLDTVQQYTPIDYLFNKSHFETSLKTACPAMHIFQTLEDFESSNPKYDAIVLHGNSISAYLIRFLTLARPWEWRGAFEDWLASKFDYAPSATRPIMVSIRNPMFEWPISWETIHFQHAFGQLLRIRDDFRELGATVLYELAQVLAENGTVVDPASGITTGAFYGAHLRTESDAKDSGWLGYDVQAPTYMSHAAAHNLKTIYIASGSQDDVGRFAASAQEEYGISVFTKEQLLKGSDLEKLHNLTWDQNGLVDYEVMLKSSMLGGSDLSSFAVSIAMRRHYLLNDTWGFTGPLKLNLLMEEGEEVGHNNFSISDGLSDVIRDPSNPYFLWVGSWP